MTLLDRSAGCVPETLRPRWLARHLRILVGLDGVAALFAGLTVVLLRYRGSAAALGGVDYRLLALAFVPVWVVVVALTGGYERQVIGVGTEEFRRVLTAGVRATALLAIVFVAVKADIARSVLGLGLPATTLLSLGGRWCARRHLHARRRRGECTHRVLVVGTAADSARLLNSLSRNEEAGLGVVGVCTDDPAPGLGVPVVGSLDDASLLVGELGIDTVAVAGTAAMGDDGMRRLAWSLERRGVDLLVAPGLTYVAVPRLVVRPVDGTPLLHVEEPELSGPKQAVKSLFDRVLAMLALVALFPLLAGLATGVVLTSRGPAVFRQERVGRDGTTFRIWKFRTMVVDAAAMTVEGNDADGLLFKLREDPRVTPFGRVLRRWSLDELPQLFNVVTGAMSLVGPRPPLASEVDRYGDDVRRRLLVRPGMTGLWQVSGRSDLPWDEAVRLDLQYVENWSLSLDLAILFRTFSVVLGRRGAY